MADARALYDALLDAWNRRNADQFAELFESDAIVIGFDGSVMNGRDEIRAQLAAIFAGHPTALYVAKVREVRTLADGVSLLRAATGMIPPAPTTSTRPSTRIRPSSRASASRCSRTRRRSSTAVRSWPRR